MDPLSYWGPHLVNVSVIVPTTCEARRQSSLLHAIDSVACQAGVEVEIIVVVNGNRFNPQLFEQLRSDKRLNVHYLEQGSLPAALRHGRSLVRSDFFAFLDDDDEYLDGALNTRLAPMLSNADIDLVVTDGFYEGNRPVLGRNPILNTDPLQALIENNWLTSCGGLFRSRAIGVDFFDGVTGSFEWTLLAFRIALARHRIELLETPTFRIHDTPGSLSKSPEYQCALVSFIQGLLAYDTPLNIHRALRVKLSSAWHTLADHHRYAGHWRDAWRCHFKSLLLPRGWRFLSYTRHLIIDAIAARGENRGR